LHETGKLSLARHDLQSLAAGLSACALAMLTLPRISRLEVLGPFALTIYLYHVFATSGMRQILHEFGISGIGVNFAFGTLAGLGVPVLLHLLADRYPLTRRYMLGKRR
jgi:surface polysaccharide O-acyltransferase-like enzyme